MAIGPQKLKAFNEKNVAKLEKLIDDHLKKLETLDENGCAYFMIEVNSTPAERTEILNRYIAAGWSNSSKIYSSQITKTDIVIGQSLHIELSTRNKF